MKSNSTTISRIEHLNLSVASPDALAQTLCDIFSWQVRWAGPAMDGGRTVHVGSHGDNASYLALYSPRNLKSRDRGHQFDQNINHIGIVVDDLEQIQEVVIREGFNPINHSDYGPCKSFYFYINDKLEIEVVEYF